MTVGLGGRRQRGTGEDGRRASGPATCPRHAGQHGGLQAPFQIGSVTHPVIHTITQEDGPDAQHQTKDGAVKIPAALQPFMGGTSEIGVNP